MFYLHFVCTDNNSDSTPFDPNWPGLDMNLLRDIFNSHKVFIFGSFNCSRYTLKQFQGDIQKAENKIFGGAICSPHIMVKNEVGDDQISDDLIQSNASLYPSCLIQDDLFEVFQYHFAVSQWVNKMNTKNKAK